MKNKFRESFYYNQTKLIVENGYYNFYIHPEIMEDFKQPFKFKLLRKRSSVVNHEIIIDLTFPLTNVGIHLDAETGCYMLSIKEEDFLRDIKYPLHRELEFFDYGECIVISGELKNISVTMDMVDDIENIHFKIDSVPYTLTLNIQR